jgi:hypothetical protein
MVSRFQLDTAGALREQVTRYVLRDPSIVASVVCRSSQCALDALMYDQPDAIHLLVNERHVANNIPELFSV